MSCFYRRGASLWIAFNDERGKRVCRPSGYRVGQEDAVRSLLAELDRKAAEAAAVPRGDAEPAMLAASPRPVLGPGTAPDTPQVSKKLPVARHAVSPAVAGPTVREYGERWLETREHIETFADEAGRLRNHVFPRIGDMRMRDIRPRHIRDFILDLKKSNVHRRGTGQGLGTAKIAPRTVRHIYSLLRRMFSAAVIDEVIEASPVVVAKGVLPKNVDKDPAWRATALYERGELVRLVTDPIIPAERRILNAIKGLAGTRHGEAAGLRWEHYVADVKPLGKLVVARSYNKDGTKTKVARQVPVHPALAYLLDEWKRSGWIAVYGRSPYTADLIVPRRIDIDDDATEIDHASDEDDDANMWQADDANKLFLADLEALGMRRRRGHDLRRTFITLAQEDGARRDVLKVITHAPDAADVMSLYTTYPWPTLCAEVAKLQIALPEPQQARVVPHRSGPDTEREAQAPPPQSALLSLLSTSPTSRHTQQRPTESRNAAAPARAEAPGAARSLGEIAVAGVADCSATCGATAVAENPVILSRWPGLNGRPTVYETVALPLSYSGKVGGNWYPRQVNRASARRANLTVGEQC